ncbi:MAG: TIGR02117 family protein [Flavobacteriales bacterium]
MLKQTLRIIGRVLGAFLAFIALYLAAAFTLSRIPVAAEQDGGTDITAYILSNGVHTDIVVPVQTKQMDWSKLVPYRNTKAQDSSAAWVGFGWGDKGFYLETPTWGDLTPRVAFNAVSGLGTSAMHATFHHKLTEGDDCKRITLSAEQYARLVAFIRDGFAFDAEGRTTHIGAHADYGLTDAFYDGVGRYNLFHTCNTWANDALKTGGQKACLWTPFDTGILRQYR